MLPTIQEGLPLSEETNNNNNNDTTNATCKEKDIVPHQQTDSHFPTTTTTTSLFGSSFKMTTFLSNDELPYHDDSFDETTTTTTTTTICANRVWYGMLFMALLAMSCISMESSISLQQEEENDANSNSSLEWIKQERNFKDVEQDLEDSTNLSADHHHSRKLNVQPNVKVAAYYYPWHGPDFHYGGGYMRKSLNQLPELGEYDDSKPETVAQHLKWSRDANINTWITSWWGPDSREDHTTRNVILPHAELKNHEICLLYETSNRLKGHDGDRSTHRIIDDMKYMAKHYWDHPNYLHIKGRPVVFLYISRVLTVENYLDEAMLLMRTAAAKLGYNIYIVGDQAFGTPPSGEYGPFDYFDAVTTYDVYGMLARGYAYRDGVMKYYKQQDFWRKQAQKQECAFMPAVSPGFNDRGVRIEVDHLPLSRRLSPRSPFGSLFQLSLKEAMKQLDPNADNILCINSFNEWHEDSQIEPIKEITPNITTEPFELTKGLEYQAYGTLYLDILGRVTRGQEDLVAEIPDRPELPQDAFLYEPPVVNTTEVNTTEEVVEEEPEPLYNDGEEGGSGGGTDGGIGPVLSLPPEEGEGEEEGAPAQEWSAIIADPTNAEWTPNRYRHKRQSSNAVMEWWNSQGQQKDVVGRSNNNVDVVVEQQEQNEVVANSAEENGAASSEEPDEPSEEGESESEASLE